MHVRARDEFASWLAASKQTRLAMGLPATQAEFARLKGVTERSLQRWKKDPEFKLLVEQRKALGDDVPDVVGKPRPYTDARIQKKLDEAVEARQPVGETPEETDYLKIKDTIVASALGGDFRAQEIFMKHWGRSWIEAEQSADAELAALDDVDLVDRLLTLIGVEAVSGWLASQ